MELHAAIEAFCNGDQQQFEPIHNVYKKPLWAFLCNRANCLEDAEELFNITSLSVFRNLKQLKHRQKLLPWVLKIAAHSLSAYYRKKKPDVVQDEDSLIALADPKPSLERQLMEKERLLQLRQCMRGLSGHQKKYFEMQYLAGCSQKQIAVDEGLNLNVLKSHVFRAKANILKCMRKYGFFLEKRSKSPSAKTMALFNRDY